MNLKFCGIQSLEAARTLCEDEELRPRKLGFYCWQKERWGGYPIAWETARDIAQMAEEFNVVPCLLMNGEEGVDAILESCAFTGVQEIQITGPMRPAELELLSEYAEKDFEVLAIIKSIGVASMRAMIEAFRYSLDTADGTIMRHIDEILLDSHNKNQFGGTGQTNDWETSAVIAHILGTNFEIHTWLAGGINETNLQQAMDTVQPLGVDMESGLKKPDGTLDYKTIARCIEMARDWTPPVEYH